MTIKSTLRPIPSWKVATSLIGRLGTVLTRPKQCFRSLAFGVPLRQTRNNDVFLTASGYLHIAGKWRQRLTFSNLTHCKASKRHRDSIRFNRQLSLILIETPNTKRSVVANVHQVGREIIYVDANALVDEG